VILPGVKLNDGCQPEEVIFNQSRKQAMDFQSIAVAFYPVPASYKTGEASFPGKEQLMSNH
jgi:hypothetical protein